MKTKTSCELTAGHGAPSVGKFPGAFRSPLNGTRIRDSQKQKDAGGGEMGGNKWEKSAGVFFLTCCSIFVNIVNHGLADGDVNCTCESNKTSRLITFTNADYSFGAACGFHEVLKGVIYSGRVV